MNAPFTFPEVVSLPAMPHDDLLDAFINGDDAEFDRLLAVYYPEGSDDD